MKTTPILIVVGLLSGGTYLVSNGFFPLSAEPTDAAMDKNIQLGIPTLTPSGNNIRQHTEKRKVDAVAKKTAKKIKLTENKPDIEAEDTMAEDSLGEIRNWQDGLAATADDPVESADALRYSLEKQPIDPEWSAEATDTLEKVIGDEYLSKQLGLVEVDCRATMCRLELDPDSEESLSKLENNLALLQGTPFTHFIIESYEETEEFNKSVVYITRNEEYVASANSLEGDDFFEE